MQPDLELVHRMLLRSLWNRDWKDVAFAPQKKWKSHYVFLYSNHAIYIISWLNSSNFKTFNWSCINDIKREAITSVNDTFIETMLAHWCLKRGFLDLKLRSLVTELISTFDKNFNNES